FSRRRDLCYPIRCRLGTGAALVRSHDSHSYFAQGYSGRRWRMKGIPFSQLIHVIHPKYTYLKLTPHYSVRNNTTYRLAKTINSLYKPIIRHIKQERAKVIKVLGREFLIG